MSRFVDAVITYRILRKLTTPFDQTDAYKLGIIDAQGRVLKKWSELNTVEERDAYTILDRMIFRLKRIISKVPVENRRISSYAAALSLVKEHYNDSNEYLHLERDFFRLSPDQNLIEEVHDFLSENKLKGFGVFLEEVGGAAIANSVGAGFSGQATPNPNPNLAGKDIGLGKIRRRPKYQTVGVRKDK